MESNMLGSGRALVGVGDSEGEAYAVYRVLGGPTVYPSRWVYMTNPIYVFIMPSVLYFLTGARHAAGGPNCHSPLARTRRPHTRGRFALRW